jgi:hypothetical protein
LPALLFGDLVVQIMNWWCGFWFTDFLPRKNTKDAESFSFAIFVFLRGGQQGGNRWLAPLFVSQRHRLSHP